MANLDTVTKVKELLEGHCYGPLRDAAEKWLAEADEKYDIKDKASKAWDKLNDAAVSYSEASDKFNDAMDTVSDKLADAYDSAAQSELVKQLKEGICSVDEVIDTFSADDAKEKFGDMAEQIKNHAILLKEGGIKYCDCPACTKAREILKDLGEDLDDAKDKVADKASELKDKLDD